MQKIYDTVIIGGGPAGYSAALYTTRAGLSTLVIEKFSPGGQIALTDQVDNYPGFDEGIDGWLLGDKMKKGAERFGAETKFGEVQSVNLSADPKEVCLSGEILYAKTVIIATGAQQRPLGLPNEQSLIGRGLSYCAHCDGNFFRGKTVVVIGGGNTAVADALFLSRLAKKVYLVHRRDTLRATKVYHEALTRAENLELCLNTTPAEIYADTKITGIRLQNTVTGEMRELACDGVFVCIGRIPSSQLFEGQLSLDESGYIMADETTKTNIPGVFAVGDVRTKELRQVITAAADGATAAYFVEKILSE